MSMSHLSALAAAAMLLSACTGEQSKSPVVTRSEGGSTVSPSGAAAARRNTSLVRFVNAMPGAGDLMIHADGRDLFGGVAFKSVSAYKETGENVERFALLRGTGAGGAMNDRNRMNAGDSMRVGMGGGAEANELASNNEVMSDGSRYTIVAMAGENGEATMRVLRDELVTDANKARIRLVHAAPGTGEIDLAVQGRSEEIFSDVNYKSEAGFKDVDPMTGKLEVRRSDDDNERRSLLQLPEMTMTAGKAYTIVVTGTARGKLSAIVFDDTVTPGASTVSALTADN